MADGNILPRGGLLRGILAGIIFVFFVFVGLSALFPLSVQKTSEPLYVAEIAPTVAQPELETAESDASITIPVDAVAPAQFTTPDASVLDAAPAVLSAPVTTTPLAVGSDTDTATDSSNFQLGGGNDAAPVLGAPSTPLVEASAIVATPAVEDTVTAPAVTVEIGKAPSTNDIIALDSNTDEPSSGGLVLSGKTLIQNSVAEPETEVSAIAPADVSAFETYSVAFDHTGDLPLLSFILLASTVAEVETVAKLPIPLTVAVEASNPDITAIIASYSASGGELVLLLPQEGQNALRKGGDPATVPAQLDAALVGSQGVVGIFDGPEGNVNQDPRMLTAMLGKLSETGHAIITVNGLGLNRASIMAVENGVPVTDISHIIDVTKGTIAVIRELDKLVLQIGDKRSITVYALARTDMLFALNFWLESNKAQLVTLAPVSAAILRN